MSLLSVFAALSPILVIFILLLVMNKPADIAGLFGFAATLVVACGYFDTPLYIVLTAALSGAVASLPISLAVGASALQISVMSEAGAMSSIIAFIKRIAPTDKAIQILIIACGIGIIFTAFGGITMAIFPPILLGLGYTTLSAIALPCLGYTGACIYALMGVPVVIFAHQANMALQSAGILAAEFLPYILLAVSLACLWIGGGASALRRGFLPAFAACLASGLAAMPLAKAGIITLSGIFVGVTYCLVLILFLKLRKQPILERIDTSAPANNTAHKLSLPAAISPWLMLLVVSLITNIPQFGVFDILFNKIAMPVEIIPGKPDKLRILWQVYFWIAVSTIVCLPLLKLNMKGLLSGLKKGMARAPRPVAALILFFAISSVYVYSGYNAAWQPAPQEGNMIGTLSLAAANLFGMAYMAIAPLLGLLVGVIGGSQSAAIAMATRLHLDVAAHIGASGHLIAIFSAMAGGLAGALSPAKVMTAAASIDCIGKEGRVLRSIMGTVLIVTAGLTAVGIIWSLL